ncbi:DHHW family protein [Brassicibacter mesophilus]|uniref:DHHW family protein n=1 Tax=Brassicibacter mesophilus TaxID=745119 RepID=UPI003D1AEDC7
MNRKNKIYKYILGVLLFLYIGVIVFFNTITPDVVFSESENRRLEQKPDFSIEALLQGKFTTNYEKYIADQFAFRDFWIGVKSSCERILGKRENNDVYLGDDGYLIQKFSKPDDEGFDKKIAAINSFANTTSNVNKYLMLVPNSIKVLEDKLPNNAPTDDELIYIDRVKKSLNDNIKFVDIYDTLYSKKDEYIFYKTDHHWTTKGAYYAYQKLSKDMQYTPHEKSYFDINEITDSFYGSLYSKSGFRNIQPDSIELYIPKSDENYVLEYYDENRVSESIYDMESLNKKDKYTVFFGGNHSLIKISTNIDGDKKLLLVKDSYANSMIPFLVAHFSEIYIVDLRYYDDSLNQLIENNDIDNVLILYNVISFFEDPSVVDITQEEK